jgi:hypothetical protein
VPEADGSIGWARALASGLVIVVVAVVALVYVPDLFLRRLTGLDRSGRVAVATAWFFVVLVALAWGVRRLQAHEEI